MISIVICTYNRAESLRDTLQSLMGMNRPPGLEWEVVLINNNSTDHTAKVAEEFAPRFPVPFRALLETKQGISAARNRAIREARGSWLLFTDDDVKVSRGWLETAASLELKWNADCASGPIRPLWEKSPEPWLTAPELYPYVSGVFAMLDHGPKPFVLETLDLNFFYGANMAFRKACLEELGGFREDLGLVGNKRAYGEDTEMIIRFFKAGKRMVYHPDLSVLHKVPHQRMNLPYMRKWRYDKGRTMAPATHSPIPPFWLVRECLGHGLSALALNSQKKQILAIQRELQYWTQLGQITGILFPQK